MFHLGKWNGEGRKEGRVSMVVHTSALGGLLNQGIRVGYLKESPLSFLPRVANKGDEGDLRMFEILASIIKPRISNIP